MRLYTTNICLQILFILYLSDFTVKYSSPYYRSKSSSRRKIPSNKSFLFLLLNISCLIVEIASCILQSVGDNSHAFFKSSNAALKPSISHSATELNALARRYLLISSKNTR